MHDGIMSTSTLFIKFSQVSEDLRANCAIEADRAEKLYEDNPCVTSLHIGLIKMGWKKGGKRERRMNINS